MNPLDTELLKLYDKLNLLHFLINFLDRRMASDIDWINQQIQNTEDQGWTAPFHGSSLVITDLTGPTDNGFLLYGRTGHFKVEGTEFVEMLRWVAKREGALSIAKAYEAFETYLYDLTAIYGFKVDTLRSHEVLNLSQNIDDLNSIDEWKESVRCKYRKANNKKLISKLRKLGHNLEAAESGTLNNRKLNVVSWFKVVEQVRHAATHSDYLIDQAVLDSFQPEERAILDQRFPGSESNLGYSIEMEKYNSISNIQLFAEYAHAIYKSLSIQSGLEWIKYVSK